MWGLTNVKDDPPPEEAVASLLEATSFWGVAPLLMRAQSLGILSVVEEMLGDRGVCGWSAAWSERSKG